LNQFGTGGGRLLPLSKKETITLSGRDEFEKASRRVVSF
jgi:hypothetical protein